MPCPPCGHARARSLAAALDPDPASPRRGARTKLRCARTLTTPTPVCLWSPRCASGEQRMGIRAVFNIRVATEDGYVDLHKELAELGVAYERCPVDYQ